MLAGGFYVSERMTARIFQQYTKQDPTQMPTPDQLLSDRELEVFQLIGQGMGTREVAEKLHLSMKTVSCYRQNIKTKLNLQSANELVRHAIHWAKANQVD